MATPLIPRDPNAKGARGNRRRAAGQLVRAGAAAVPQGWLGPERSYLAARGPQIAALAAGLKQVRAIVNAEKNFFDVSGSPGAALVPTAICLTNVPIGDDVQQRSGRSIKLKGWSMRISLSSSVGSTGISNVRILVVKDLNAQGISPNLNQVLQNTGTGFAVLSPVILTSQQTRWVILVDDVVTLVPDTASTRNGGFGDVRNYSADLQHHVEFIGNAGTVADVGAGAVWMFLIADTVTLNAPTTAFYSRIRYYDN